MPSPMQSAQAIEQRNIAGLAAEFGLSLPEVRVLFEAQRTRLMKGAKVGKYFSIVAVRNIRRLLTLRRESLLKTP